MYEDHDGTWVTDLAFSKPLKLMANSVLEGEESVSITDLIPGLQENEFKPACEFQPLIDSQSNFTRDIFDLQLTWKVIL